MAKEPSVDEAVARAQALQNGKIQTIREVAESRQSLEDVKAEAAKELAEVEAKYRDRMAEAERADVKSFSAAVSAGWTVDELKKIGFPEPDKKARVRRKASTRKSSAQQTIEKSVDSTTN
ncbi:hypothetical protein CIK76_18860 [Glutamicibacter sp. BW80]|uniref:hypothetical protein n=1 Tax=Glutamicibacter sp. BW80 TaxID=2024404 RepID=UPI000BB7CE91|nr:hypothetical protein [Glutamicibacter sp. BW80]PCC27056.1 hypothetical protein CIK76_18860 [Glutamicibacter sp. BW80]